MGMGGRGGGGLASPHNLSNILADEGATLQPHPGLSSDRASWLVRPSCMSTAARGCCVDPACREHLESAHLDGADCMQAQAGDPALTQPRSRRSVLQHHKNVTGLPCAEDIPLAHLQRQTKLMHIQCLP